MTPPSPHIRYHAFDALRGVAMLLGLLYHATYSFFPGIGPYYFCQDRSTSAAFPVIAGLLHGFRMHVFFAMAGFFTALGLERRGVRAYLRGRWRRLGVPLLVAAPLMGVLDWALRQWAAELGVMAADYRGGTGWLLRPLHLWFLYYLLLFCAAAAALWWMGLLTARPSRRPVASPVTVLVWALPTALLLTFAPEPSPAFSYGLDWASLLLYGPFFAFGLRLYGQRAQLEGFARHAPLAWALAALSGTVAYAPPWALARAHAATVAQQLLRATVEATFAWWMVLALLGTFAARFSRPSPALRLTADSAYWVYLLHFPLVVGGQVALASWAAPAFGKYLLLLAAVCAVCFGTYFAFVRGRWLGRALGETAPTPAAARHA